MVLESDVPHRLLRYSCRRASAPIGPDLNEICRRNDHGNNCGDDCEIHHQQHKPWYTRRKSRIQLFHDFLFLSYEGRVVDSTK